MSHDFTEANKATEEMFGTTPQQKEQIPADIKPKKHLTVYDRVRIAASKEYLDILEKDGFEYAKHRYKYRLRDIEKYEEESSKSIIKRIKNTIKLYWYSLPQDWKICVGFIIGFFIFVCYVCLVCFESLTPMFFLEQWIGVGEVVFPICTICFIVSAIKNRKVFRSSAFYFSWILSFLLFLPKVPTYLGYGTTQIGDFYEKKEYTEDYIVIMSRKPESEFGRKQYTLPATIRRSEDYAGTTGSTDWLSGDSSETEVYGYFYHIEKLYFPNGGYLTFDEENNIVFLNEEVELEDYHNNTYYITLTDQIYDN